MLPSDLTSLATFLAVAEERSFTRAAKRRGVSPSAISHAMRTLEEELGVRLLARTTRSVALTQAGEQLVERLKPALTDVGQALDDIAGQRSRPGGRVRLLVPRLAVSSVLAPRLGILNSKYPDIVLDVTTDDSRRDIVADGFDAGVHFGEYIEKDMIAVRVSPDQRPAIVGSPGYFRSHPKPKEPRDLLQQQCINFRHGAAGLYRWEFEKGKKAISVGVTGPLIVDDLGLVLRAALDGVGLAFVAETEVSDYLAKGTLLRVLQDWCQPYPGFFLYYPSRRQQPASLTFLISVLRL
ncbi:LysR family transcriptional regulator [Granulicella aggregans]|uniref:LysR family transcriptional regulator n=1 Tax=Granulicella aggregans TaxID=474949 RepID=UPI0021DF6E88|nr:LysR family transcriptional regulator [Granulicella aggregans]